MNGEQKYNVVFSGRFAPHFDRAVVMQNLAGLYKTDVDTVAHYFSDADTIVKSNLDQAVADQYVAALCNAGALCETVAVTGSKSPEAEPSAFLEYRLGISELRYAPLPVNRITQSPAGININRVDKQDVPFQDILLLSIYEHPDVSDSKMLLFIKNCKQPFVCDCFKITFSEFFDVKGSTMQDSVRRFAQYLLNNNKRLLFDKNTYEFVQGGKLPVFNSDAGRLTTALSAALAERNSNDATAGPKISPQQQTEPAATQIEPNPTPSAVCPNCGLSYDQDQSECSHCGIVFVKWQQNQERKQDVMQMPAKADDEWVFDDIDLWARQCAALFSYFLIGAFVLPLFKHSVLLGSSMLIWPWNIMGLGMDAEKSAAMATVSIPEYMPIWGLLPLCMAIGVLGGRQFMSLRRLAAMMFLAGLASLVLILAMFYQEAEILGLMFTPPTFGAGIMILLTVIAGMLVAGANHLRKRFPGAMPARVLSAIGGGLIILLMAVQLFASSGGWSAWTMLLLYWLMIGYGVLGLFSAFHAKPDDALLHGISLAGRIVLGWAPVACFIAQNWLADSYTDYVVGGGGGFINVFISIAKGFLLYYGFSFLMAVGFTAYLEQAILKKSGTL